MISIQKEIIIPSTIVALLIIGYSISVMNTQTTSSSSAITPPETITLSSSQIEEPTFRSSSFTNTHGFNGDMGTGFDYSGQGDLVINMTNTGANRLFYKFKSPSKEVLTSGTLQSNQSLNDYLSSFTNSLSPGFYSIYVYNDDGSPGSFTLKVSPE